MAPPYVGLMDEHDVPPDDFLSFVHDIDHSVIPTNEALNAAIDALPGKKYIFTNGTIKHAEDVMTAIGLTTEFHGYFDIKASDYEPKPAKRPYDKFINAFDIAPERAAMFEDIARNLEVPHHLGMTTVMITSKDNEDGAMINRLNGDANGAEYVHHMTDDLAGFLSALNT